MVVKKIIGILLITMSFGCDRDIDYAQGARGKEFNGMVSRKFISSAKRGTPYVIFTDCTSVNVISFGALYEFVNSGDSIEKKTGTVQLLVFRNDSTFKFLPDIFGSIFTDSMLDKQ